MVTWAEDLREETLDEKMDVLDLRAAPQLSGNYASPP